MMKREDVVAWIRTQLICFYWSVEQVKIIRSCNFESQNCGDSWMNWITEKNWQIDRVRLTSTRTVIELLRECILLLICLYRSTSSFLIIKQPFQLFPTITSFERLNHFINYTSMNKLMYHVSFQKETTLYSLQEIYNLLQYIILLIYCNIIL